MAVMRPSLDVLQECMKKPQTVRNVCILAHVDHGKTTIADSLLATNRLVSKRMAGQVRYLDDRTDEQERGITMKSSTVSLLNMVQDAEEKQPLLLNLIDTPGHIDFSSEVSAALRVCDGALVVVDLVEGVCVQTRETIKQAFAEKCKMILVLNKIDKLITELHKEVNDIFSNILHAVEDCNVIVAELYQYEYPESDVDIENTGLLFSPDTGNVIFASAIDGWGFTTKQFAKIFINSIKNETIESLDTKLWNFDCYVDSKTNTIRTGAIAKNKTNLFIQLIIKTIFYIYTTIVMQMERDKVNVITQKLKIDTITRDMNHSDSKVQLRAIMQAWSPIAETILSQTLRIIPPPSKISGGKIEYLIDYNKFCEDDTQSKLLKKMVSAFKSCESNKEFIVAYVSKMFCCNKMNLSQNKPKIFIPKSKSTNDDSELRTNPGLIEIIHEPKDENPDRDYVIIALTRVFSGKLTVGQEIFVLPPNHIPSYDGTGPQPRPFKIEELYVLFGRDLVLVNEVHAGNICGIGGLESTIVRTATLSSTLHCVPFIETTTIPPVVRNAIEPVNPKDLPILRQGLRMLMQSDSCVQIVVQESGEHVLVTAGDVHLAKCLEDLTSKFAKIEINVSSPMVSLRETVTHLRGKCELRKDLEKEVQIEIAQQISLSVVCIALPDVIANEIQKSYKLLSTIEQHQLSSGFDLFKKRQKNEDLLKPLTNKTFKNENLNTSLNHTKISLDKTFEIAPTIWPKLKNKIWSVGRMSDSVNLLMNSTPNYKRSIFETLDEQDKRSYFDHFVVNAFISCCKSGPLCEEPLKNCSFLIKKFELITQDNNLDSSIKANVNIESMLCGRFREAFEEQQQRLMEPMFTTSIQVNTNILGKVYSVVSKRHGKVLDAVGMDEEERTFLVKAEIPVVESTGFANEIRKTTSGQAIPNLKFSHFEIIDGDPFYEPLEDIDDQGDINVENAIRATKLRKDIRRRKGLQVDEQVVVHAEKQRTLNKKK